MKSKRNIGFTILELLVTLALLSLVATFLFSIFNSISKSYKIIKRNTKIYQNAAVALEQIHRELKNAIAVSIPSSNCYSPYIFKQTAPSGWVPGSSGDELFFTAYWNNDNASQKSEIVEFGYVLKNNILYRCAVDDTSAHYNYRTARNWPANSGDYEEIARGIRSFKVTYFTSGSPLEHTTAWNPLTNAAIRGKLPERIRITIVVATEEDIKRGGPQLNEVSKTFVMDTYLLNSR